ncbi:hypothetical protein SEPCBS119000_006784, partial [Sporothrix epigloea]
MPSASPDAQDLPASANKETPQQPDQTPLTTDSVVAAIQSATDMEVDELAPPQPSQSLPNTDSVRAAVQSATGMEVDEHALLLHREAFLQRQKKKTAPKAVGDGKNPKR